MDAGRLHGLLEGGCSGVVISGVMQGFTGTLAVGLQKLYRATGDAPF